MIFNWQNENWNRLLTQRDRLPHALLLAGPQGGGKAQFARTLAARLLCEKATGTELACGECLACGWFAAGNHPDFRLVEPDSADSGEDDGVSESDTTVSASAGKKKSDAIKIGQIRALSDFLAVGTHRQGARIVIIQPAEAMNQATANSLLKVLEEPSANTLFLLVTHNGARLLPTIRSRCQSIDFPKPNRDEALAWLQLNKPEKLAKNKQLSDLLAHVGGMPLAAVRAAESADKFEQFLADLIAIKSVGPVATAAKWEPWLKDGKDGKSDIDKSTLTTWLQKWVYDLVAVHISGRVIYHESRLPALRAMVTGASAASLIDCYNELLRIKAVAQHPLNARLFLEDMLSRYARAVAVKNQLKQ